MLNDFNELDCFIHSLYARFFGDDRNYLLELFSVGKDENSAARAPYYLWTSSMF